MRHDWVSGGILSLSVPICFRKELSSRIDPGLRVKELGGLYIHFDGSKSKPVSSSLKKLKEQKIQDEVNNFHWFFPFEGDLWCRMSNAFHSYARMGKFNNSQRCGLFFTQFVSNPLWLWLCRLSEELAGRCGTVPRSLQCCDAVSLPCPQVMKKSVIGPDFEKKDAVPPYSESKRALKLKHKVSCTSGVLDLKILHVRLHINSFEIF